MNWAEVIPSEATEEIVEGCDTGCNDVACGYGDGTSDGIVLNQGDYGGAIVFTDWVGGSRECSWTLNCPADQIPQLQFVSLNLRSRNRVRTFSGEGNNALGNDIGPAAASPDYRMQFTYDAASEAEMPPVWTNIYNLPGPMTLRYQAGSFTAETGAGGEAYSCNPHGESLLQL